MKRTWMQFFRSEEGSVIPLVGFAFLVLVGSVGLAIDISRRELAQAKLSSALDAAGLAAGSTVNTTNLTTEVNKYFYANYPVGYLGTSVTSLTAVVSANNTIINLTADGTLPTTFGKVFGVMTMPLHAESEITRSTKGMELVLVMDNTGSMGDNNKLEDMKTAAKSLVDILYGSDNTVDDLWVGVVPFSQTVNIGSSHTSWMNTSYMNGLAWGPTSWGGCVDARYTGRDVNDDPPASEKFKAYYWPDDSNNDWIRTNGQYRTVSSTLGPNKNCPEPVLPMVAEKSTVKASIDAMEARGNTHVGYGAVWGWRMLSPRWRGLWGGQMNTNSLPLDYNTPLMNKAVVILTDGMNTMDNTSRTAYWYLSNGRLGSTNQSNAVTALNNKLSSVCTSMKSHGIIIYTVAFDNPGSSIETLLQNCASDPSYYFDSPTGSDLQQAFRVIGDSLSNLRISH
ncbi:MAG: vWA domain-containing protein [Rickettsiales bacterium]